MKNILLQLFIIFIGALLIIAGFCGVKEYFYNNYKKNITNNIIYNNYSNISFNFPIIEMETTTTTKNITLEENVLPIEAPTIKEDESIIYDNLTITQLTEKLNKNLNSTLTNTGYYFAEYYVKTGLDPYLAVAIVLQETGCKWTCSSLVRECNNIGGMKGGENKCNGGSYRAYNSLEEGIYGYLDMLYTNYYSKGLTTPELINTKYATSTTWSDNINKYIEEIKIS